jgi:hypothetical protein
VFRERMEQELRELLEAVDNGDQEGAALELADVGYYGALYSYQARTPFDVEVVLGEHAQRLRELLGMDPLDDLDWWAARFALTKYHTRFVKNDCCKDDAVERLAIRQVMPSQTNSGGENGK